MRSWQLQEAQEISVRGEPTAVVISRVEYDRLRRPRRSFVKFLRGSPLAGVELDLERDRTPARTVRL